MEIGENHETKELGLKICYTANFFSGSGRAKMVYTQMITVLQLWTGRGSPQIIIIDYIGGMGLKIE